MEHAVVLAGLLGGNFGTYAQRFAGMNPVFANYPQFRELLDHLASGPCAGCRKGECLFTACKVKDCVVEKGVDFCFECAEFPCTAHGMPEMLEQRWKKNNEIMKDKGVEAFYEIVSNAPRYP